MTGKNSTDRGNAGMNEKKFNIGTAIGFGWNTAIKNFPIFLAMLAIFWLVSLFFQAVTGPFLRNPPMFMIITLISWTVSGILTMGMIKICLKFVDGQKVSFGDLAELYSSYPLALNYLGAFLLFSLVFIMGLAMLIVPAIILGLRLQFFGYFIADKKMGPAEALNASWNTTRGNSWDLLLLWFVFLGIAIAGALALLAGLLVAIPVMMVAVAFVYRKISGGLIGSGAKKPETKQTAVKMKVTPEKRSFEWGKATGMGQKARENPWVIIVGALAVLLFLFFLVVLLEAFNISLFSAKTAPDANTLLQRGVSSYDVKDYKAAKDYWAKAAKMDPSGEAGKEAYNRLVKLVLELESAAAISAPIAGGQTQAAMEWTPAQQQPAAPVSQPAVTAGKTPFTQEEVNKANELEKHWGSCLDEAGRLIRDKRFEEARLYINQSLEDAKGIVATLKGHGWTNEEVVSMDRISGMIALSLGYTDLITLMRAQGAISKEEIALLVSNCMNNLREAEKRFVDIPPIQNLCRQLIQQLEMVQNSS